MRNRIFFLTAITMCTVWHSPAFCKNEKYTRPISAAPRRSTTTPVSTGQTGYTNRVLESTYINTNRIITGNVSGDRHFRGTVPYGSVSEFQADLGSDDFNSFIRRSAYSSFRGGANEYYLPSQTVTSIRRGSATGLTPPKITFAGGTGKYTPVNLSARNPGSTYYQKRPLLPEIEELERRILKQPELAKIKDAELEKLEKTPDEFVMQKKYLELENVLTAEPLKPAEPRKVEDTYERLRQARQKRKDEMLTNELIGEIAPVEIERPDDETETTSDKYKEQSEQTAEPGKDEFDEYNKAADMHVRALEIRGQHATFEKFAKAKFEQYIKAAGEFIKGKKYYMAADAYSLAEVYDRNNIEAITGMAHSLFAAGEYMSSAYLVRKALRINPDYAKKTAHLSELLIDKDMIENRVVELEKFTKLSKSPELAFLMAYVLYRTDRPDTALQFIDIAAEKMGDSKAVLDLKVEIKKAKKF
jgi:tetratricopeptide (TPR) repeat protein